MNQAKQNISRNGKIAKQWNTAQDTETYRHTIVHEGQISSTALSPMFGPLSLIWLSASSIAFAPFTALYPSPPWPCTTSTALYPLYGTLSALWPSVSSMALCLLYNLLSPLRPSASSMSLRPLYDPLPPLRPYDLSTALYPLYGALSPLLSSASCTALSPLRPSASSMPLWPLCGPRPLYGSLPLYNPLSPPWPFLPTTASVSSTMNVFFTFSHNSSGCQSRNTSTGPRGLHNYTADTGATLLYRCALKFNQLVFERVNEQKSSKRQLLKSLMTANFKVFILLCYS